MDGADIRSEYSTLFSTNSGVRKKLRWGFSVGFGKVESDSR
jgi:hypothetical protein